MDKLEKALVGLLVAVVLALCGYAAVDYVLTLRTALVQATADAKTAQDALKKSQATLALREAARVKAVAQAASARASLEAALSHNTTWAEAPVPQEVQDDLCKTLHCVVSPSADGVRSEATNDGP